VNPANPDHPSAAVGSTALSLDGVGCIRGTRTLLHPTSLTLGGGELVALLGANGAGKSTLVRCALGLDAEATGRATIDGTDIRRLPPRERAQRVAYLPQQRTLAWPVRVQDVVALGRFAWGAPPSGALSGRDGAAVARAIRQCDLQGMERRRCDTLSGGELARVHCARALAAETPLLIADEPVAELDPRHQHEVMSLIRHYVDNGNGALVVLHDINLAARYADRLLWLREGSVVADGGVAETLSSERLQQVYGVTATVSRATSGHLAVEITGVAPPA
jgi:iron complex transport system ATP-binding protein